MTPQPQQEYIVSELQLRQIELDDYPNIVCQEIRSRPHPAPAQKPGCYATCPFDDLCANDVEKIQAIEDAAARQAREDVLEILEDLRKWSNGEYNEAYLSDNEREMRIHNDYGCKIWAVMQSLRAQQAGDPR